MGMSSGGSDGGPMAEINVTPLVDVVLVLLIIFMVTMPVVLRQITLEVPRKVDDESKVVVASKPITATLDSNGGVTLNDGTNESRTTLTDLASKIRPMIDNKTGEKVVFVDFTDDVLYGNAVLMMDTIRGAGAEKVALKIKDQETLQ